MSDGPPGNDDDSHPRDDARVRYIEELGMLLAISGWSRMAGRVLAFLMLSTASHVSSGDIARALRVSAGSVSTATRELAEAGCIRQIAVPGSRGHYFRSADDVCGAFLVAEQRRHHVNVAFAEELMGILDPDETKPLKRLANMRDYHAFLDRSHLRLRHEWEELKRRRDAARHHE